MNNEKPIQIFNRLIEINNDRIEGYEIASQEEQEADLKELFARFSDTSAKCREDLIVEVDRLGGEPTRGTKTTGKFFRAWMDIKVSFAANKRKAILSSCEFCEDVAIATYGRILKDDVANLTALQLSMITHHYQRIKADHDEVRLVRELVIDPAT